MAKPTKIPTWATTLAADVNTGVNNRIEPSAGKKITGFNFNEKPPRQDVNWLYWITGEWLTYLDTIVNQDVQTTASPTFDIITATIINVSNVITVAGNIVSSSGNITSNNGNVQSSNGDIIAGIDVKAVAGNVEATNGDIESIVGDIIAGNNVYGTDIIADNDIITDTISEKTSNNGVQIDGVTLKDFAVVAAGNITSGSQIIAQSSVKTDDIVELTLDAGIKIDNVLLKDGYLQSNYAGGSTNYPGIRTYHVIGVTGSLASDTISLPSEIAVANIISIDARIKVASTNSWVSPGSSGSGHFHISMDDSLAEVYLDERGVGGPLSNQSFSLSITYRK